MSKESGASRSAHEGEAGAPGPGVEGGSGLEVERILRWADAHRTASGRWPDRRSGAVVGAEGETWSAIDSALRNGHRGLPGGSSLARFLAEERGITRGANPEAPAERLRAWTAETFPARRPRRVRVRSSGPRPTKPPLTVEQILTWADAHREATGRWPQADSGPVLGSPNPDETWAAVRSALEGGRRGLPGGTSLASLLQEHRGVPNHRNLPRLDVEQILAWADAHHEATGAWPRRKSGPIAGAPGETWTAIDAALISGGRGLPGGSSLPRLLAERRGVPNMRDLPHVTVEQVLSWADAHREATGRWPANDSGPVRGQPDLSWSQVNRALMAGYRGLPGGTTLADLLQERRGVRNKHSLPGLDVEQVLAWADAHREATGEYPQVDSGPVRGAPAPGETWARVNMALSKGLRGLPGGSSVAQVLAEHREYRGPLTVERILAWADAHHAATGRWPTMWSSGAVRDADDETWPSVNAALRDGRRGLPGGSSLAQLLAEHRAAPNIYTAPRLTVDQILAWARAHRKATGRWPSSGSGPMLHAEGEHWGSIETALRDGYRGLPGGQSVGHLIREHAGPGAYRTRPALRIEWILAWADAHHEATGAWPVEETGKVRGARGETWRAISGALFRGGRGLPGGTSLARLLAEHRGVRNPKALPPLTAEQILAWADAHRDATGRWPNSGSGPVAEGSEETWATVNMALFKGHRGLPGGSSLGGLLAKHRPVRPRRLSLRTIRAWAGAYRAATGRWPNAHAGPVGDVPDETWGAVDAALKFGRRGLPGGSSLTALFGRSLDPDALGERPDLTVERVLSWADAHRAATGRWPSAASGPVVGAAGEKWINLDMALRHGRRGLPRGTSLARLIAEHRGAPAPASPRSPKGRPRGPRGDGAVGGHPHSP